MVVVDGLPVDRVGVATALVQIRRRLSVLRERAVNAEAVKKPAQEAGMLTGRVGRQRAASSTAAGVESDV